MIIVIRMAVLASRTLVPRLCMHGKKSITLALVAWLGAFPALAQSSAEQGTTQTAAKPVAVVVRVGQHENYDRVVFDWPSAVKYTVNRDGGHAAIHFAAPGTLSLAPTANMTRARSFAASTDADGHLTVSFALDPKAATKDFSNGASIAVDILDVPGQKPAEAAAKPPAKEKPKTEAAVTPPPAPVPAPAPAPVSPVTDENHVAGAAPLPIPPAPQPVEAKAPPVINPPSLVTTPQPVVADMPVQAAPPAAVTTPIAVPVKTAKDAAPGLAIGDKPTLVASLDPHTPLRAAVWARGGSAYIVFDRKLSLTIDALKAGLPSPLVDMTPLDIPAASGFSFPIPDNIQVNASRDGTIWKIYLTKQQPDVPVSATLVAQPDFALGARYILPLPDAPDPVQFTDPVVGDKLILIPLNQTEAFSVPRHMADFDIWPAAQGLVIKPIADKLVVRPVSDGIEIASDSALHLSPATETGQSQQSAQKAKSAVAGKSLFDFAGWRGKSDETFTQTRHRLQQTIVDVPERDRNRARLELARFYFARGYGAESLGLLNYLAAQVPDLNAHSDFLAMTGAAKILAYRPEEGLKDLDAADLPDQPEIKLWQAVGNAQLRNWTVAEDKFAASEALLVGYPEPFYSRFFVLAIESALSVGNDREAADWLDTLSSSPHSSEVEAAIEYLQGVLHAKAGRASAAAEAWKTVDTLRDRLYKVRAELALVDLGVANKSLTPAQAADRLEAMRFAWRGDDLEVDILHRLGQFYIQANNVKAGLAMMAQAIQYYPNSPLAPKIKSEMSQAFHDVFLGDLGKNLSPLEALTIYQQYRDTLMPAGDDGIAVTRNLAERLTAIDLLDQAGNLLEDLVKNKLKGDDKIKVATRLAAIRLLDHKPEQAMQALDLDKGETIPDNLQRDRELLLAKSLSELNRQEEALAVLKDDQRAPAKILRADIDMRGEHWADASKTLLELVGPPPKAGDMLKPQQADWLVRCAVAMALAGDQPGLDHLAIDYGAPMAGTQQNNMFRILVEPEKPGQLRDISGAQSQISEVDMFQGFLDSYRKENSGQGAAKP